MNPMLAAARRIGPHVREVWGSQDSPWIRAFHSVTDGGEAPDEVAWCSSCISWLALVEGFERSLSKRARSWLRVGTPVLLAEAKPGDVVIFMRGEGSQPGPEVIEAPGHVALFEAIEGLAVRVYGGNQSDRLCSARYLQSDVLGVRRLAPVAA